MRADRDVLLATCAGLGPADWKAPSGCPGWSVADVVTHMGALFSALVDPSALPDATDLATEAAQEVYVAARRSWTTDQVVADYRAVSAQALEVLAGMDGQDFEVPLGDLGTYPASILSCAFSFDHYIHIRADLFAPRGPLTAPVPPSDELRLVPALTWVEAALPQQNPGPLVACTGAIDLVVDGPGARTIRFGPGPAVAEVRSEGPSFLRWITQRATWDEVGVAGSGDERHLAVARELRVF